MNFSEFPNRLLDVEMQLCSPSPSPESTLECFDVCSTEKFARDVRKMLEPKTSTRGALDLGSGRFKRLSASGRGGYLGYPVKRRGNTIGGWAVKKNKDKEILSSMYDEISKRQCTHGWDIDRKYKSIKRTDKSTNSSSESKHANFSMFTDLIGGLTDTEPEAVDSPADKKDPCLHCLPEMKLPPWDARNLDYNFTETELGTKFEAEVRWEELCSLFTSWKSQEKIKGKGRVKETNNAKAASGPDSLSLSNLTITGTDPKSGIEEKCTEPTEQRHPALPTEIWYEIINYCLPSDIPNLRQTCKTFAKYLDKSKNPYRYQKIMRRCNYNMRCHLGRMIRQYIKQCEARNRVAYTALIDPDTHRYQYDCWSYGISEDVLRKRREEMGLMGWVGIKESLKKQKETREALNRAGEIPIKIKDDEFESLDGKLNALRVVRDALEEVLRTREQIS